MEPDADPAQPTRSAITDAGIEGNSDNRTRTRSSNPSNTAPAGGLEYDGGPCDANAHATVFRARPNRSAIARCDNPSAT
jgi:hypothetical protein